MMCPRCGHDAHDDRADPRCGEIVGGGDTPMPEPVYCECVDADALLVRVRRAEGALKKISNIRDSVIGHQTINWSLHIYPLVAILREAGYAGRGYDDAVANIDRIEATIRADERRANAALDAREARRR